VHFFTEAIEMKILRILLHPKSKNDVQEDKHHLII